MNQIHLACIYLSTTSIRYTSDLLPAWMCEGKNTSHVTRIGRKIIKHGGIGNNPYHSLVLF